MKISDLIFKSHSFAGNLQTSIVNVAFGASSFAIFSNPVLIGLGVFCLGTGSALSAMTVIKTRDALNNPNSQYAKEVRHAESLSKMEKRSLGFLNLSNYVTQLVSTACFGAAAVINPVFSAVAGLSFLTGKILLGVPAKQINSPSSWYNKRKNKKSNGKLQEVSKTIQNQIKQSLNNKSKIENEFEAKQTSAQKQSTHIEQVYGNNIHEEERSTMGM